MATAALIGTVEEGPMSKLETKSVNSLEAIPQDQETRWVSSLHAVMSDGTSFRCCGAFALGSGATPLSGGGSRDCDHPVPNSQTIDTLDGSRFVDGVHGNAAPSDNMRLEESLASVQWSQLDVGPGATELAQVLRGRIKKVQTPGKEDGQAALGSEKFSTTPAAFDSAVLRWTGRGSFSWKRLTEPP